MLSNASDQRKLSRIEDPTRDSEAETGSRDLRNGLTKDSHGRLLKLKLEKKQEAVDGGFVVLLKSEDRYGDCVILNNCLRVVAGR